MRALRTAVVLVLALALSAPVLAADFQAGLDAAERGDIATALKEWRLLAEQGDPDLSPERPWGRLSCARGGREASQHPV